MYSSHNNIIVFIERDTFGGIEGNVIATENKTETTIYIYDDALSVERGFYHSIPDIRITHE